MVRKIVLEGNKMQQLFTLFVGSCCIEPWLYRVNVIHVPDP